MLGVSSVGWPQWVSVDEQCWLVYTVLSYVCLLYVSLALIKPAQACMVIGQVLRVCVLGEWSTVLLELVSLLAHSTGHSKSLMNVDSRHGERCHPLLL
jgi:hypothetical protein